MYNVSRRNCLKLKNWGLEASFSLIWSRPVGAQYNLDFLDFLPTWIDLNFNCGVSSANCENKKVLQCKLCVGNKRLEEVAQHTCLLL